MPNIISTTINTYILSTSVSFCFFSWLVDHTNDTKVDALSQTGLVLLTWAQVTQNTLNGLICLEKDCIMKNSFHSLICSSTQYTTYNYIFTSGPALQKMFCMFRNLRILVILTSQSLTLFSTATTCWKTNLLFLLPAFFLMSSYQQILLMPPPFLRLFQT